MQKHIFRTSDIRGIVGVELLPDQAYLLTKSVLKFFEQKSSHLQRIAVGFDGRLYGPEIYEYVSQAIVDAGYELYFLGICATPVFVYGLHHLPVQGGILITASGSSAEYNGFKIYLDKKQIQGQDLQEIYKILLNYQVLEVEKKGKIIPCPILDQYVDSLWQEFSHLSQYDFPIIIDCGNGATIPVIKKLIKKMEWKQVKTICDTIDGSFPCHNAEPTQRENMQQLLTELKKRKYFLGIAFDGDGDRMVGIEANGNMLLGDIFLALFAQDILKNNPHRSVVYDAAHSWLLQQVVAAYQGNSMLASSTLHNFKQKIEEHNAIVAGQLHGRYFFKDRHLGYADGIYAFCRLLDILVKERKSMHELLMTLPQQQVHMQDFVKEA